MLYFGRLNFSCRKSALLHEIKVLNTQLTVREFYVTITIV